MGADGWIYILDATKIDASNFEPYLDFSNVYRRTIFERDVYTVYGDTEHHDIEAYHSNDCDPPYSHKGIEVFNKWRDEQKRCFDERREKDKERWLVHTNKLEEEFGEEMSETYSEDSSSYEWKDPVPRRTIYDYKEAGFIIDEWEVWT